MTAEYSQWTTVWAFMGIQLSEVQVPALLMCLSRWKGNDGKEFHPALTHQKKQKWIFWCEISLPITTLFLIFFVTHPVRGHLGSSEEIHLTYPDWRWWQNRICRHLKQPSLTLSQAFFAPLHAPEIILLYLQQGLYWETPRSVLLASLHGSLRLPDLTVSIQLMKPPIKTTLWTHPAAAFSIKVSHIKSELKDQDDFPLCSMLWPFIFKWGMGVHNQSLSLSSSPCHGCSEEM